MLDHAALQAINFKQMQDAPAAFYRTLDPVRHLRVAVCIRRIPGDPRQRLAASGAAEGGSDEGPDPTTADPEDPAWCSWSVFSWQEKQFGPKEILRFVPAAKDRKAGRTVPGMRDHAVAQYVSLFASHLPTDDSGRPSPRASSDEEEEDDEGEHQTPADGDGAAACFRGYRKAMLFTYVDQDNFQPVRIWLFACLLSAPCFSVPM